MKAAKTWCLAGLMFVAGLSSASCGKDEGTDGGGGKGMVIGGSGGSGGKGTAGTRVTGGTDNAGGTPTVAATTKLGRACVNDTECKDPAAPDLKCVTAKQTVLGGGAPPKGLCSMPCAVPQAADDVDACEALGPGALCYQFDSGSTDGYCVEGCLFGTPDIGETKCHSRPEFACNPALFGQTDTACTTTTMCQEGEVCLSGFCNVVLPACLPACRGDLDCEAGMFCDQSFLNGVCVSEPQEGKALGEPCTVPGDNEPNEPDECLGFCQADAATGNQGHCAATCPFAQQCAWNAATEKFDGLCAFGSVLTPNDISQGDFGFCALTCNCSTDCNDQTLGCELLQDTELPTDVFKGAGLCLTPDATTVEYSQCGSGGAGAGGDSGMPAAGAAGAP